MTPNDILTIEIQKQIELFDANITYHKKQQELIIKEKEQKNQKKMSYLLSIPNYRLSQKFQDGKISKFTIMKVIGYKLQKENDNKRWSIGEFTKKYLEVIGEINPWTTKPFTNNYDKNASIRSLIYEMSPCSSQHWFKYGILQRENKNQWAFLNLELLFKNANNGWAKTSGRSNGKWFFKENIVEKDCIGLLPTIKQLDIAKYNRKIGRRNNQKMMY
jgi:hypothetical protein